METKIGLFEREKLAGTGEISFWDYLKRKSFRVDRKKSLFRYITNFYFYCSGRVIKFIGKARLII